MSEIEKAYWNHEVSRYLDIGESTLRKWCIELEKNGYIFIKGAKDSRAFTDHDLKALNYFKQLTKVKKHTKEQAAIAVVGRYGRGGVDDRTTSNQSGNNRSFESLEKKIEELLEYQEKQTQFNEKILEKLENQEKYIKDLIEKRDRLLKEKTRDYQEEDVTSAEVPKKKRQVNRK